MRCKNCGQLNPDTVDICQRCGRALEAEQPMVNRDEEWHEVLPLSAQRGRGLQGMGALFLFLSFFVKGPTYFLFYLGWGQRLQNVLNHTISLDRQTLLHLAGGAPVFLIPVMVVVALVYYFNNTWREATQKLGLVSIVCLVITSALFVYDMVTLHDFQYEYIFNFLIALSGLLLIYVPFVRLERRR
jgi:hypothetical protein